MVTVKSFGSCPAGEVHAITLSHGGGMMVELLSLGAAVRTISVPDRDGRPVDVCLGYDTPEEYNAHDGCMGACVGRHANRIAGARFTLDGTEWSLTANEGENQLHGGAVGFHHKLWHFTTGENSVTFSLDSPHLDEGFPGNLHVEVTYTLRQPGQLELSYRALSDQDTVVNLTNHSYFNLSGHDSGGIEDHLLSLRADRYTPCGPGNIPTGALRPVAGTPLDLRVPTRLGDRLDQRQLAVTRGYDHNFVLAPSPGPTARLYSPQTGITMEVETSMPGLQLYTAGFLDERRGKGGVIYRPRHAVCLESQYYPDAIHHSAFPSPVLRNGEWYDHHTCYRFYA